MEVSKKFDKRYNLNEYIFVRNYVQPHYVESIWKNKQNGKALIVKWSSKSSYFIDIK